MHIKKYPVTVKEYLYSLLVYPLFIKDPDFNTTAYRLMANLNKYIQYKFLSEEGLQERLQNNPTVKEDVSIWSDNYLAKMLKILFEIQSPLLTKM